MRRGQKCVRGGEKRVREAKTGVGDAAAGAVAGAGAEAGAVAGAGAGADG
ncbi:MAG: hypothetical protein HYY84_16380 [Deltaproteobacteria bacterium]|nr:hypothetical protein [Deltaproteobacteria bacterium]